MLHAAPLSREPLYAIFTGSPIKQRTHAARAERDASIRERSVRLALAYAGRAFFSSRSARRDLAEHWFSQVGRNSICFGTL